jgi:UDP-3-O-[3-hydroxymyristoyl] glucosamine N-acyltransferase
MLTHAGRFNLDLLSEKKCTITRHDEGLVAMGVFLPPNYRNMQIDARQLAAILGGTIDGDASAVVTRPAPIEHARSGDFAFLDSAKYEPFVYTTQATILLVSNEFQPNQAVAPTLIRVSNVRDALATLLEQFGNQSKPTAQISADARIASNVVLGQDVNVGLFSIISSGAEIGDFTWIHDQVYLGAEVRIGKGCEIHHGAKIYDGTIIGDYSVVKANAVIGAEGFGFAPQADGSWRKVPQVGNVEIGNHVEIGANTCIDRGALGATRIADGAKLDNLIQIAHNVQVGAHTAMAAQVGVAGSAEIGAHCLLGGQAGVAGHIRIADGTKIQAQSGIAGGIKEPNTAVFGSPAIPYSDYVKAYIVFKSLPEMERRLRRLEKELNQRPN